MTPLHTPGPTVRQLSMTVESGYFALCVLAKRTYLVDDEGRCSMAPEQPPLLDRFTIAPETPHLVKDDIELVSYKPRTDVVVKGHAYSGGSATTYASIHVAGHRKEVLVVGDRRATVRASGGIVISPPERFEKVSVSFANAYGGKDGVAQEIHGNPFELLRPYLIDTKVNIDLQSPFVYPKNPCGKGFLANASRRAVEACTLPNLEDPRDLLTPDRIEMGHPARWIYMPAPQGLGWVNLAWFPRMAFSGYVPAYEPMDRSIPEVSKGLFPKTLLDEAQRGPAPPALEHRYRVASGAPLDQQFPYLAADATIELRHLHPRRERWALHLPGDKPKICADGRDGKLISTNPVLHSVVIEPDVGRASVIWRGAAPARRAYFDAELSEMPLLVEW